MAGLAVGATAAAQSAMTAYVIEAQAVLAPGATATITVLCGFTPGVWQNVSTPFWGLCPVLGLPDTRCTTSRRWRWWRRFGRESGSFRLQSSQAQAADLRHNVGMDNPHAQRVLKAIRATLVILVDQFDELSDIYDSEQPRSGGPRPIAAATGDLRLQRGAYTVHYKGRECFLGCSFAFRILDRLAQRPNELHPDGSSDRRAVDRTAGLFDRPKQLCNTHATGEVAAADTVTGSVWAAP